MARTILTKVYTDSEHKCDRCGRTHAKVYEIRTAENTVKRVGSTCCKRMFGWTPTKNEIQEAILRNKAQELVMSLVAMGATVEAGIVAENWIEKNFIARYAFEFGNKNGVKVFISGTGSTMNYIKVTAS